MYLLRRAALRTVSSQPSLISAPRTFVTKTPSALRPSAQWQVSSFQRRFATEEASPAQATTSGETVTTEPSKAEQEEQKIGRDGEVVEKSIANSETADAATPTSRATSAVESATETFKETVRNTAQRATEAASGVASSFGGRRGGRDETPGSFSNPQPSKILYVGNLFFEVSAEDLERKFSQHGNVLNCKIAQDAKGLSKGFGYVEFDTVEAATEAISRLNQHSFQGRRMAVQYHVKRAPRNDFGTAARAPAQPSKTLFIGNLSFQMSDKDLNDLFKQIKNVLDVRVAIDRRSGQPRGFAHADFIDIESAQKAKDFLENKEIYGRQLRVDFSSSSASKREI